MVAQEEKEEIIKTAVSLSPAGDITGQPRDVYTLVYFAEINRRV